MDIHEFQAKQLLKEHQVPVLEYDVASSVEDVQRIIQDKGWLSAVLKVQIHAGGRGKAGGVKIAHDVDSILKYAKELLGKKIINEQTGPRGMIANQIIISPIVHVRQEYYLGMTIDINNGEIRLIASPVGGVNIEEVIQADPNQILIIPLPSSGNFHSYQLLHLSKFMKWDGCLKDEADQLVRGMVKTFISSDATLLEINPLVLTQEGHLLALDAKLSVDDNALFRQVEIKKFFDPTQIPENEARAQKNDLSYVSLNGDIGCMVNGAGLAMATMDIIEHLGGKAANFLDVGGSATKEKIAEGFKIILSDPKVKGILINIFGGIMNCETLSQGVCEAAKELEVAIPIVVRMEGTHVEEGKKILLNSSLNIDIAANLPEAAQKIIHKVGA